ncbi:response regulator [Paraburkholderia acidisoli]|uniref:Response regulator n=1 Tax=Paraburkholderia acidisoli TaxID=2571748 RepID=A0A7Z2GQP6_9BURK|nr:response regulator [Paraburkholderia acidisoli]QGZ66120.1 response regulator [Paraburkholderia acidisoli]
MTRILVVDDDSSTLAALASALAMWFEVVTASDGMAAWTLLHDTAVDGVIADLRMPGMSGGTLCEKIRDAPGLSALPVILVSGEYSPPAFVRYDRYFKKPVDVAQLAEAVQRLLHARPIRAMSTQSRGGSDPMPG